MAVNADAATTHWFGPLGFGSTWVSVAFRSTCKRLRRTSDQIAQTAECVLRRKLPCSTVNEEGGLKKQSGRTWTPAKFFGLRSKMTHLFSLVPAGIFSGCVFFFVFFFSVWREITCSFVPTGLCFGFLCYFAFLRSDGSSSFQREHNTLMDVSLIELSRVCHCNMVAQC